MGPAQSKSDAGSARQCFICEIPFNRTTKKRVLCTECSGNTCKACTVLDQNKRRCKPCNVLLSTDLIASDLNTFKTRHLKDFLDRNDVPIAGCAEREYLVGLILERFGGPRHQEIIRAQREHTARLTAAANRVQPQDEAGAQPTVLEQPGQPRVNTGDRPPSDSTNSSMKGSTDTIGRVSVDDIEKKEEIDSLTVKQLKIILTTNLVDYKGCKEKHELINRVQRVWESRQANKLLYERLIHPDTANAPEYKEEPELCKICMDAAIDCVLLECGHMVTCTKCGKQMNECPICRQYVVRAIHIFRA